MNRNDDHTKLVNNIVVALSKRADTLVWKNQTGMAWNRQGVPIKYGLIGSSDILACVRGNFVAIECKTGKAAQSVPQRNFEAAVRRAGGAYIVARSVEDALDLVESVRPA